jgi:hypothetical protein
MGHKKFRIIKCIYKILNFSTFQTLHVIEAKKWYIKHNVEDSKMVFKQILKSASSDNKYHPLWSEYSTDLDGLVPCRRRLLKLSTPHNKVSYWKRRVGFFTAQQPSLIASSDAIL